jgi:hypothetical protein
MTDLFAAIMTRYTNVALSSLLTGLWNTQAPQDAVFPYGVFQLISDVPDWTFSENLENILLQFNLFSDTSDPVEICNLFELLKTAFDFLDLTIANYETVSMIRENAILTRNGYWQYNVTYRVLLGKY